MYDDAVAEMSSSAHVQRRHEKKGRLICDVKLAWIAPGQRIDYTFEIEMQAMSAREAALHRARRRLPRRPPHRRQRRQPLPPLQRRPCQGRLRVRDPRTGGVHDHGGDLPAHHQLLHQPPVRLREFESVQLELKHSWCSWWTTRSDSDRTQFVDVSGDDAFMAFMVDEEERQR